ncbi:ribonuclease HII [Candidatus Methanophagaceae archaeon]|nr:MAG: Ribonuclease HII [Methanophagales archaeon]KAF5432039.1 ribonuclease HII [Methanophagales archaeon]KAF5437158.1 ribonuclease HII [Methanophagales archaeon]
MREIGVDEAGKGPVIGSLFVAGVLTFEGLEKIGVKDSKKLRPSMREHMAELIEDATEVHVVEMTANEIDEGRKSQTLNEIMVDLFSEVVVRFQPDKAFVDAADVNQERFATNIRAHYEKKVKGEIDIISEWKADDRYPIVSAASIVAKVHRDRSIKQLAIDIGAEIGSGYPSDAKTIRFLKGLVKEKGDDLPTYIRQSWKTVEKLISREKA